jgi:polygalacturonase
MQKSLRRAAFLFALLCGPYVAANAQDARPLVEPVIPAACAVLNAAYADAEAAAADDTDRIQNAIDHCPGGQAVKLAAAGELKAFVARPLRLHDGVTLWIDAGATLYASTDPAAYDTGEHTCGTNDSLGKGCRPFISMDASQGGGIVGDGVIDGQGGHAMRGKSETWWQLSRRAQKEDLHQNVPNFIVFNRSKDVVLYRITLRNSLKFHFIFNQSDGLTAWGIKIDTPADARNTDGFDPVSSRNVTLVHSFIRAGDDDVAIKAGSAGPSENISILHNHFYAGHGMSIGSNTDGGVHHVLVEDLSMDGTTSGLRIKSDVSRGGPVNDVHYRNVCLRDVKMPIDVKTNYDPNAKGNRIPVFTDIHFEHVHSLTPGKYIFQGFDAEHLLSAAMDDFVIDGKSTLQIAHARFALGPGAVRPLPVGEDVGVKGEPGSNAALDCKDRFVEFPAMEKK